MALILVFHNDQKTLGPIRKDASYNIEVFVGNGGRDSLSIAKGRVEHHQRSDGWEALVQRFLDERKPRAE
jgi:hypothetical protein